MCKRSLSNQIALYKHKNNTSIAAEVIKSIRPDGKPYARIKIRWWKITHNKPMYCMNIEQWLTDATIEGNSKQRQKYPLDKWRNDWELI